MNEKMVFCFSSLLVVTSPHFLALKNYLFYVICLIQAKDVLIYALFSGKIKTIGIIACVKNVKNPKSENPEIPFFLNRTGPSSSKSSSTLISDTPRFVLKIQTSSPSGVQIDFSLGSSSGGINLGSSGIGAGSTSGSGSAETTVERSSSEEASCSSSASDWSILT